MSKTLKTTLLSFSIAIVLLVVAGGLGVHASSNDGAYRQLGVYSEVLSRIRSEYVEEPNFGAVTDGALHGLLESLDSNSSYLSPAEYKEYKLHKGDGRANIGAAVSKRFGYAAVVAIVPGGAADKAGIQNGDIIEAIEGKTTREMSLAGIHILLSGEKGSHVNLSVVRARRAEPQKITVVRDLSPYPGVEEKPMDNAIGYIDPESLGKGRAEQVAAKIKDLQSKGAKKLVLDLRNIADGDANEAIAIANLFLSKGTITYLQGQKYPKQVFMADPAKAVATLPVVVLVNRSTAGPAEIIASAILDNARGDVVGDKTFGDGSVQKLIEIPDGSALILSVAKYYTPNGKAIQDTAVTPNIQVASEEDLVLPDDEDNDSKEPEQPKKPKEDEQLKRAVEVLKART